MARFADAGTDRVDDDQAHAAALGAVLDAAAGAAAWCSPARAPFEVRLAAPGGGAPVRRRRRTDESERVALDAPRRDPPAREVLADPPYNVVVYDAPTVGDEPYHWWVRIVPRPRGAGRVRARHGLLVESVDPSSAAAALRSPAAP